MTKSPEQRLLRFAPGHSDAQGPGEREEALFVLEGSGSVVVDGASYELRPETAIAVAPRQSYRVQNPGPGELVLVSVLVPPAGGGAAAGRRAAVRLEDRDASQATSDRRFRILLDPETGLSGGTQFVGYIPTGKAPEHYHSYDEVIYVLDGEGVLHTNGESTPIGAGSEISLSPEQRHCLENTGTEEMRVVALFTPAGSPSEAYLPDGTSAYVEEKTP